MLSRATLALIALALPAVTPPAEAQATRSDSAAILDAGRQFSAAYMQGDVAALTALYTADAVIFPERSDALTGPEAIERYWTPAREGRVTRHQLTPTRVVIDGKHAYDYGTYEVAGERAGKPGDHSGESTWSSGGGSPAGGGCSWTCGTAVPSPARSRSL